MTKAAEIKQIKSDIRAWEGRLAGKQLLRDKPGTVIVTSEDRGHFEDALAFCREELAKAESK